MDGDGHQGVAGRALRCLAVGIGDEAGIVRALPVRCDLRALPFAVLTEEVMARLAPDLIICPLVAEDFDAFELAALAAAAGFCGRFLAAVGRVPNPGLVERELRGQFPGMAFELLLLEGQ